MIGEGFAKDVKKKKSHRGYFRDEVKGHSREMEEQELSQIHMRDCATSERGRSIPVLINPSAECFNGLGNGLSILHTECY